MVDERDASRMAELERQVADLESRLGAGTLPEPLVPLAVSFAWWAAWLSSAAIFFGLAAAIMYGLARSSNPENHNVIGEVLLVAVPLVLWPLLWISFGFIGLRRLERGTRGGRRLALIRLWLALPLVCIHVSMTVFAGLFLWPHLDLIMFSLVIYFVAEILFTASGISVWRAKGLV